MTRNGISPVDEEQRRLDDPDDDHDDGTRGIWAAYERDGGGRPLEQHSADVESLKDRLKRGARLRAGRSEGEIG